MLSPDAPNELRDAFEKLQTAKYLLCRAPFKYTYLKGGVDAHREIMLQLKLQLSHKNPDKEKFQ